MSDTPTAPAEISLGNVPIVQDFANNLIIFVGAVAGAALHMAGSPLWAEIMSFAASGAGFVLSAVHVSTASWLGGVLNSISATTPTVSQTKS